MSGRETDFSWLSTCLLVTEFRFEMMLYCNLGNEIFDAGHTEFFMQAAFDPRAAGSQPLG